MEAKQFIIIFVFSSLMLVNSECPREVLSGLPFALEYALWRGWRQAIVYTSDLEQECKWTSTRLVKCFNVNGIATAENLYNAADVTIKLGVILIAPFINSKSSYKLQKLINKIHDLGMNAKSYDWLIIARENKDFKDINEILNNTAIRFDQNFVVSYPTSKSRSIDSKSLGLCDGNFIYKCKNHIRNYKLLSCDHSRYTFGASNTTLFEDNYYRTSDRMKNISRNSLYQRMGKTVPLFQTAITDYNFTKSFQMTNVSRLSLLRQFIQRTHGKNNITNYKTERARFLYQYFKVRINSTLYAYFLGTWSRKNSMSEVEIPYPVESRTLLGEEIIIGRCNSTQDGVAVLDNDGPSTPLLLDDVMHFLNARLQAKLIFRNYTKLGFRTYEGTWTGLLGGLMDNSVDIALEPVTAHPTRHNDMDFIFPLSETIQNWQGRTVSYLAISARLLKSKTILISTLSYGGLDTVTIYGNRSNIYIRHQETSTVRDIFLAPFSLRLIACVGAVALFSSIAIMIISRLNSAPQTSSRPMAYTEALLWSTGILCQQGGSWTPPHSSGSILLLVCLLFSLVTYNAYAAFITSVLSVRVASVDTVTAVLNSPDFKIGYIRNGADQMYLMSTKDAQLNEIYIRGYSETKNLVSSVEEGLARTANDNYAFFAGQRAARITLRSLSQARGRCAVRELPVHSTHAPLAFPLPRHSPYTKPILISLLQLRSGGVLARLGAALVPDMPQCEAPSGFASARATDVRSALFLLAIGLIAAALLGLAEYCWKNRQDQLCQLRKCCKRLLSMARQ